MLKRHTMTLISAAFVLAGGLVFLTVFAVRELWVAYVGMAVQLLGPSFALLYHVLGSRRRESSKHVKGRVEKEFRRYILTLFFLITLLLSLEMIALTPKWPTMWCACFAMTLISGLIGGKSLKYRRK